MILLHHFRHICKLPRNYLSVFDYNIDPKKNDKNKPEQKGVIAFATRGGILARGRYNSEDGSIMVLSGSQVRINFSAKGEDVEQKRQLFLRQGKIQKIKDKFILQTDVFLKSFLQLLSLLSAEVVMEKRNGKLKEKP